MKIIRLSSFIIIIVINRPRTLDKPMASLPMHLLFGAYWLNRSSGSRESQKSQGPQAMEGDLRPPVLLGNSTVKDNVSELYCQLNVETEVF